MSLIKNKRRINKFKLGLGAIATILTLFIALEATEFVNKYDAEIRDRNEFLLSRFKNWSFNGTVIKPVSSNRIEIRGVSHNMPDYISSPLPVNFNEVDSVQSKMYVITIDDSTLCEDVNRGDSVIKFADSPQIFIGKHKYELYIDSSSQIKIIERKK